MRLYAGGPLKKYPPAKAGVQLGTPMVTAAPRYYNISNWAPAFAGVVFGERSSS